MSGTVYDDASHDISVFFLHQTNFWLKLNSWTYEVGFIFVEYIEIGALYETMF